MKRHKQHSISPTSTDACDQPGYTKNPFSILLKAGLAGSNFIAEQACGYAVICIAPAGERVDNMGFTLTKMALACIIKYFPSSTFS